jgi:hypothetical protein
LHPVFAHCILERVMAQLARFGLYYVSAGLRNPPAEAMRFATARTLYVTGIPLLESI